ncbi:MAG: glycoside hydrolase family 31 protein [Odoribacteraceae bacterium]|jgi:alpha-glucosidase|nr:glycoside hydrolase family 31 protein [Odoribacteraceae bacterium]
MLTMICCAAIAVLTGSESSAQSFHVTRITVEPGEYWWGGAVGLGSKMPYVQPLREYDLATQNSNNQVAPLLLSSKGRYAWSDYPFSFSVEERAIVIRSPHEEVAVRHPGKTLREAYLAASAAHFPPTGALPDTLFFTMPQYNTWIELIYNQNQDDILRYARDIIDRGFPPGVLMIDDNWQKYYGNFEFKPDRFSNPKGMVDTLHALGFKVMLWLCPFVSPDSPEYRLLSAKGFLVKQRGRNVPAVIPWWNGQSACFDLTNPDAAEYLIAELTRLQTEYGVDGFKFDAGDNSFYPTARVEGYAKDALSVDHTLAWTKIGLSFTFNEFRAAWKMGGEALVQRLGDKSYSWTAGVQLLIPDMTAAGLLGHAYTCPDMIGGGQYGSFIHQDLSTFDQTLFIRSAQVHALMPMMQFSVSPWRILSRENVEIVRRAARLHEEMGGYILDCARSSSRTGEPIVRHMEYAFPGEGFATCHDQFMLGERYMVAPVVTKENRRTVKFPRGKWRDERGKIYRGGKTETIDVPLDRLPYFEKL